MASSMGSRADTPSRQEKRPLAEFFGRLSCYGLDSHCTLHKDAESRVITEYEVQKLTTMRVFGVFTGTVLENPVLWCETFMNGFLFVGCFITLYLVSWKGWADYVGREADLRAFIAMFTTLVGLLLSFYTALNIKRWWEIRRGGVAAIEQACAKLTCMISQGVTRDKEVLSAVSRYSRVSLLLSRKDQKEYLPEIASMDLLSQDEFDKLNSLSNSDNLAEIVWAWMTNLISQLNQQGLTSGPPHYCALLAAVEEGRRGSALIMSYLRTPIPMMYVHLLGFMVKIHNIMLQVIMAVVTVKHYRQEDDISVGRTMFRSFFMPFMYNAILIINDDLSDPFNGDVSDFPVMRMCASMATDAENLVSAGDSHLPDWLKDGRPYSGIKKKAAQPDGSTSVPTARTVP